MSSLAAARADNFYQPPDWDPSKESRNKFHNSHGALGDRARKLHEGILIIRFEMPFHVWCDGCGHLIGRGVRFNAEKKQIGAYHSTKIWSFTMRAPCCKQKIEVHTDPRNADYVVVSGGKKKAEAAGEDEAGGRVAVDPRAESRPTDPIALLESKEEDKLKAVDAKQMLISIHQQSSSRFKSDVDNNRELRRAMRSARREEQTRDQRREQLGLPEHITLAPETKMDRLRAAAIDFGGSGLSAGVGAAGRAAVGGGVSKHTRAWKHDRKRIASSSIFSGSAVVAASTAGRSGSQKRALPSSNQHHGAVANPNKNSNKSQRIDTGTKLKLSEPHKR